MGDFIRYILTGTASNDLSLTLVETALKAVDTAFSIQNDQAAPNNGDVLYDSDVYGEVEINLADEDVFREDIEDLRDELAEIEDEGKAAVLQALDQASGMIAFQLSEAGHDQYRRIDPLWDWLFERYPGLLQIDEEGYYSQTEQLLVVD